MKSKYCSSCGVSIPIERKKCRFCELTNREKRDNLSMTMNFQGFTLVYIRDGKVYPVLLSGDAIAKLNTDVLTKIFGSTPIEVLDSVIGEIEVVDRGDMENG